MHTKTIFDVTVLRTSTRSLTLQVEADSRKDAEEKALSEAGGMEFPSESNAEYLVEESRARTGSVSGDPGDEAVRVYTADGESTWNISCDLTDRWGEINYAGKEKKPLFALESDSVLLERLRRQLMDESSFIVRKDGIWGVLLEEEFCTDASDPNDETKYDSEACVLRRLQTRIAELAKLWPGVDFAIGHPELVHNGRLAIWAFVPDGRLLKGERALLLHHVLVGHTVRYVSDRSELVASLSFDCLNLPLDSKRGTEKRFLHFPVGTPINDVTAYINRISQLGVPL